MRSERGFSIIELMISGALMMIIILAVTTQFVTQVQTQSSANLQLQARVNLREAINRLASQTGEFPRLFKSGVPITYVACYNESGEQIANKDGHIGFRGIYLASPSDPTVFAVDDRDTQPMCPQNQGGVEVHMTPDSADVWRFHLDTIILNPLAQGQGAHAALRRTHFRQTLQLGASL